MKTMTDGELIAQYPDVPWRLPIGIKIGTDVRLACRLCIARFGMSGTDFERLYATEDEHRQHMTQFH
jgi:hypothetical protein